MFEHETQAEPQLLHRPEDSRSGFPVVHLSMANYYFAEPHGMQHCYIPFLYVIDFKGALNFGETQLYVALCQQGHSRVHTVADGTQDNGWAIAVSRIPP
jgi:hypothetical protein